MQRAEPLRSNRYEVLGHLASGGMGEILLARRVGPAGFEKLVVLKRPLAPTRHSPDLVHALIEEARLLARISHPNVCNVHGLEEVDGELFLELEFLQGLSLWTIVSAVHDAGTTIPDPILCAVFEQACEGLHAIHTLCTRDGRPANVVHRDVSPGNLFVTDAGLIKVLDLGIAKSTDSEQPTPYGHVKGKWPYLSPEQAGGNAVDARADVFALGLVLYDVVRGRRPALDRIGAIAAKSLELDGISPALARVIARATAAERDDRFASAREMGEAVRAAGAAFGGTAERAAIAAWLASAFDDALARAPGNELARTVDTSPPSRTLVITSEQSPHFTSPTHRLEVRESLIAVELAPVPAVPSPRRRWFVLAAAAAITIGVALAIVTRGRTTAARPVAVAVETPVDAAPPPPPPAPVVPASVPAVPKPKPKPSAPKSEAMGRLTIDSEPWATLRIGGRTLTTPVWSEPFRPGAYRVVASTEDGRKRVLTITIEPGRELRYGRIDWSKR